MKGGHAMSRLKDELLTGVYRHFKGRLYEVLGVAQDADSAEDYVVYRALYGDHGLFVRAKSDFMARVKVNGDDVSRFTFVCDCKCAEHDLELSGTR
jgi:hypothetical protein